MRASGMGDADVNGLDLETFLLLLRADLTTWGVVGLVVAGLGLLTWSSWRSRRVLRRCLVLSLAAHFGLAIYGSTVPAVRRAVRIMTSEPRERPHIRSIRVDPVVEPDRATTRAGGARVRSDGSGLELPASLPELVDAPLAVERPSAAGRGASAPPVATMPGATPALAAATPHPARPLPGPEAAGPRPEPGPASGGMPPIPGSPTPTDRTELDRTIVVAAPPPAEKPKARSSSAGGAVIPDLALRGDARLRPGRSAPAPSTPARPGRGPSAGGASASPDPLAIAPVTPRARGSMSDRSDPTAAGDRPPLPMPVEVPEVYRPRVAPDRATRARLAGASEASERAVERALDWLARHQDRDGRWNAAVAHYDDGTPVPGDRDFRAHCPPDEVCSGPCAYWEADTALTGLALLAYLGAGYTQLQGRHAETVDRGLDFLIREQKPDGDLRGPSVVVGMYGHAMATLALCEALALSGEERLRAPAERAVGFLVRARALDRQAWRYQPGAATGDTSILGWVVMGLKSAREIGLTIPEEPSVRRGILDWLDRVSSGSDRGLARYQPGESVTPTMTAEAWVCRQFLGAGGPGPDSDEAAAFLLRHESDRGPTNFYYWYYATLALYQHGGAPWTRWNAALRDRIVGLQHTQGHRAGSWDPDQSLYGPKGGRIYGTALATLTLEVYYRYLRLYDEPGLPPEPPDLSAPRPAR